MLASLFSIRTARVFAALAVALAVALAAAPHVAGAAADATLRSPRLVLPGDHRVNAGEWIDLGWSAADSVSEMELLLSVDGGRSFGCVISPELAPGARHFRWRVPKTAAGELRLRIRFNRGGREIEGAPTTALRVLGAAPSDGEPLALPVPTAGAGSPMRTGGGQGAAAAESRAGLPEDGDDRLAPPAALAASPAGSGRTAVRLAAPANVVRSEDECRRPPRSMPLRP